MKIIKHNHITIIASNSMSRLYILQKGNNNTVIGLGKWDKNKQYFYIISSSNYLQSQIILDKIPCKNNIIHSKYIMEI